MRDKDFDRKKFILEEWPTALESGEFEQTNGILYHPNEGYCCLGVACELLRRKRLLPFTHWEGEFTLPDKAKKLLGLDDEGSFGDDYDSDNRGSLAELNDDGFSFKDIAQKIREIEKDRKWLAGTTLIDI